MSGTGRKRSSKWDLDDEPKFTSGSKQMRSAGSNSSKWVYSEENDKLRPAMRFSSKESFSGGRGSNKDNAMNKDYRALDTREWDTDGSYSDKMSQWKQKRRSQSPENGWSRSSRSWSRSPPRGFRQDSAVDDRKRMRVGGSTQPCRNFAVGKCRRGSLCNFLHHDNQNHENSWEGKHREDGASRYSAIHESKDRYDGYGKSMDEFTREREDGAPRYSATHESRDHSLRSGRSNDSDGYGKVSMDEFTREREDGAPRYSATHESRDHSLRSGRSNDSDGYGKVSMDEFTREREVGAPRHSATHESRDHSLRSGRSNDSDGYGKVSMDEFTREREDGAPRHSATHESRDHSLRSGRSNDSDGYGKSMDEFTREREDGAPRYSATYESRDHSLRSGRSNDSDGYGKVSIDEFSREREDGAARYSATESREHSLRSGRSNGACINFAKGRCRMGASCKFVHDNDSDGFGKVSVDEFTREREIDRRHRDSSFEQGGGYVSNRTSDTPCKFFANGNCRNGRNCRFSHDRQACRSPNRRLRDDKWARNPSRDHQISNRRKSSDSISPSKRLRDDRRGSDGDVADPDRVGDSPKRNDPDFVSDTAKLTENKSGNVGASEAAFTASPMTDGWGHGLTKSRPHGKPQILNDKKEADLWIADFVSDTANQIENKSGNVGASEPEFTASPMTDEWALDLDKNRPHGTPHISSDKKEADCWIAENTGANMHGSQSLGTNIWPGDAEMSPDWNYKMGSSSHMEEHGQSRHGISQSGTYLATSEHDRVQVAPGQGIDQNAQNLNPLHTSSCHAVGQSQVAIPILPSNGGIVDATHSQQVSTEKMYTVEPNIMDSGLSEVCLRNPPTQNAVSNEQLAQITNLSASLAHILGAGQQLPQLYAALNSQDLNDSPSLEKTQVPAMPVSITCIKPDPAVGLPKQYDPMHDSIEQKNADASGVAPAISPSKNITEVETLTQLSNSGQQYCGDSIKAASSEFVKSDNLIQLQPGQNTVVNKDNSEVVAKERQTSQDGHKTTKENGPQNIDQNVGHDDAKKIKDMKEIRSFKFALAEFVKELLKPAWKEGRINKDDYKTIVKKVVDKVTGTMQGANIPQTQEKIDHYLSFSKPKLNKLVQAYVEKVEKVPKA